MNKKLTLLFLSLFLFLTACSTGEQKSAEDQTEQQLVFDSKDQTIENVFGTSAERPTSSKKTQSSGGNDVSPDKFGVYDGYFKGDSSNLNVECLSGTRGACKLEGDTLTFTKINAETVYSISGNFRGNIIIDVGNDYKFELEFRGFSLISGETNPIMVRTGEEVSLKAKKGYSNYIYDDRAVVGSSDETLYSAAVYSDVDLEIGGKGKLTVVSKNNKGIHTKDDLQVKNLTLQVLCADNALKGNDSVTLTGGTVTLIATDGDAVKTTSSSVSSKGNQRGNVSIVGGVHTVYAASDGIDAAHNIIIEDDTTKLTVDTVQYASASQKSEKTDDRSQKGLRAGNVIVLNGGTVSINASDNALHANQGETLENGASPVGNVTVNGGVLTLQSKKDGIHADGTLKIIAGSVNVDAAIGFEANCIDVYGGSVSIRAEDAGIRAMAGADETVKLRGGYVYILSGGCGISSENKIDDRGVVVSGGHTVVFALDGAAISSEYGYSYEGGRLLAVMPQSITQENCLDFSTVGTSASMSLSKKDFFSACIEEETVTVCVPSTMDASVIALGDASSAFELKESVSVTLDQNGILWH